MKLLRQLFAWNDRRKEDATLRDRLRREQANDAQELQRLRALVQLLNRVDGRRDEPDAHD